MKDDWDWENSRLGIWNVNVGFFFIFDDEYELV